MLVTNDVAPTLSAAANKNVRKTQQTLEYKANRSAGMTVAQARAVANASQSIMRPASDAIADAATATGLGTSGGGSSKRSSGGGSGGGGGGSAAAAAVPSIVLPNLDTYIAQSQLLKGVDDEGTRSLSDYDSVTGQQRTATAADQDKRRQWLQQSLDEAGENNAESFASRGLGRSGLVMQAQDKIDAQGDQQKDGINQLMTNLLANRAAGRLSQLATNRTNRQNALSQLTQQYNTLAAMPNAVIQ
jgi:hypothetical protein